MFLSTDGFLYSVSPFISAIFTFDVSELIPAHTVTLSVSCGKTLIYFPSSSGVISSSSILIVAFKSSIISGS